MDFKDLMRVRDSRVQPYKLSDHKLFMLVIDVDNMIDSIRNTLAYYERTRNNSLEEAKQDLQAMLSMRDGIQQVMRNRGQSDKELDIVLSIRPPTDEEDIPETWEHDHVQTEAEWMEREYVESHDYHVKNLADKED